MFSLLKLLKNYKKETILAPLFKMTEAIFDLLVPLVVQQIIDVGIGESNRAYILAMGGVLLFLAVLGIIIAVTANYFAAKAAAGFGTDLRHNLFDKIQHLSCRQLDNEGISTLITRITSDLNLVQSQVNMALRLLLRSPFIVFGAMIMAFFVDGRTGVIFVISIPVLSIIVFGLMFAAMPVYRKVQSALDKVTGLTRENLNGVRVIRAFNKESEEIERYRLENDMLNRFQVLAGKISSVLNPLTLVVVDVSIIAILYFGGVRVNAGAMTQGQVVALVNYMSQILVELVKLANMLINLTRAFACGDRIKAVLDIEPDMEDGTLECHKNCDIAVEFDNVGMTYNEGSDPAVSGVNLKVKRGDTVGIIGGTGSGKSTLINLLPRMYETTEGSIKIFGSDIKDYKISYLKSLFGIVPQKAVLFKGTVRSNLLWGNENAEDSELEEALKISQSYDFVMGSDDKLDSPVASGGKNFSGGQRQRLTIARALVKNPEFLILDDSASALDFATDLKLRKALSGLKETTTFIVSQRASSVMSADVILVLDDGKVAGLGSHNELLESCDLYREIYNTQFKSVQEGVR